MEWHVTDAQNLASIDKEIGGFLSLKRLKEDQSTKLLEESFTLQVTLNINL